MTGPKPKHTPPTQQVIGREAGFLYRIDWLLHPSGTAPVAFPAPQGGDVVLRRTPLAFVDSVWEVWGALLGGVPYVAHCLYLLIHMGSDDGVCVSVGSMRRQG